jgi:hypothetical protein
MTEPNKIKSEDGYTFYRLSDGRYADSLQEENIDMSWNSFNDVVTTFKNEAIGYSVYFD